MKNRINRILKELSLEEKVSLLTGTESMSTAGIERLGIKGKRLADGPHGVRKKENGEECTAFPNLCLLGATWDVELAKKMGIALAKECIEQGVDILLGPGVNIKRHILCGRNFEYVSEDPVLAGEIAAAYINGLQSLKVAACLKHYAANNQEKYRSTVSVDADMRTLMEIYFKPFEIAIKKSSPASVMCAYNKIHSIWCSENEFLLTEVLRDMWKFNGFVISDWSSVHNPSKAFKAGLNLQMPKNPNIMDDIQRGLDNGEITVNDIDKAAGGIIDFLLAERAHGICYDRNEQHNIAREIASAGTVLLKNENQTLPITKEKYKKIVVIGEFAKSPLISGQGSAAVDVNDKYIESPLEELRKILGDEVELEYAQIYQKTTFPQKMLWPMGGEFIDFVQKSDLIVMFIGSMESEDTEEFDRRTAEFNPNYELFINYALTCGKKIVVVMQSGSAMILGNWNDKVDAVVQMWLAGESAGGAIADVLCGRVNPSGKLSETFPSKLRTDLEYPGNSHTVEYCERLFVGYRYYDIHPEEIVYPFGHGLSYTDFEYSDLDVSRDKDKILVSFTLKNIGDVFGSEVVQLYVGDPVSTVVRPVKELKKFAKISLQPGEYKSVVLEVDIKDMGYYNVLLHTWVTEPGEYIFYIGSSSRNIKLQKSIYLDCDVPYTMIKYGETMIG